jgi:protein phosphatase
MQWIGLSAAHHNDAGGKRWASPARRSAFIRGDHRNGAELAWAWDVATKLEHPEPALIAVGADGDVALDVAAVTDIGLEREKNEDAYLIGTLHRSLVVQDATDEAKGWLPGAPAGSLLVVADGMGGQGGGDVASHTAVTAVTSYLLNSLPWAPWSRKTAEQPHSPSDVNEQLSSAVLAGDQMVKNAGAETDTPRMGTTLTMALVLWPAVHVAHVGDTRCYLLRAGKLRRLTTDHNMAEKLASTAGQPSDRAEQLQSILWNMLGGTEEVPRPELTTLEVAAGDTLLLCSDGLNKHVADQQIQAVLESSASSRACCAQLVALALDGGGTDNVTVLVAKLPSSTRRNTGT